MPRLKHDFLGDKIHIEHVVPDSHCVTNHTLVLCESDIIQSRAIPLFRYRDDVELAR